MILINEAVLRGWSAPGPAAGIGRPVENFAGRENFACEERKGIYRLNTRLALTGALTDAQKKELLGVAQKCPVHKLMSEVKTEITTVLADEPQA